MSWYQQSKFDVVFEWGSHGLEALGNTADIIVIVDVLSFSTCVSVAVDAGALVYPFRWKDDRAAVFAQSHQAYLAESRNGKSQFSLSPKSLAQLRKNDRIVLPSPNGSHLCTTVKGKVLVAGCLRNANAVGRFLNASTGRKLIVAAGERWHNSDTLRPSCEDFIGAGAIVSHLQGLKSPEARTAELVWSGMCREVRSFVSQCSSGQELIERGFVDDVTMASDVDSSQGVPIRHPGGYFYNYVNE